MIQHDMAPQIHRRANAEIAPVLYQHHPAQPAGICQLFANCRHIIEAGTRLHHPEVWRHQQAQRPAGKHRVAILPGQSQQKGMSLDLPDRVLLVIHYRDQRQGWRIREEAQRVRCGIRCPQCGGRQSHITKRRNTKSGRAKLGHNSPEPGYML